MGNENKVIELLRNEAMINPVFNAVCHVFAVRQRTRYKVTIANLIATMKKEGFTFSKEQYIGVLKFLGTLGLGQLVLDSKKRVRALDHIKVTLQSIGQTSLGNIDKVKKQHQTKRFSHLIGDDSSPVKPIAEVAKELQVALPKEAFKAPKTASKAREAAYPTFLTVLIEGRLVAFPAQEVKPDNLGEFLVKFKKLSQEPSA